MKIRLSKMSQRMKMKFDKHWINYNVTLAFGAILDPRMKLDFIKFCYSKIDASTCHEKLENVKTKLYDLFEEYASNTHASSTSSHSMSNLLIQAEEGTKLKGLEIFSASLCLSFILLHENLCYFIYVLINFFFVYVFKTCKSSKCFKMKQFLLLESLSWIFI